MQLRRRLGLFIVSLLAVVMVGTSATASATDKSDDPQLPQGPTVNAAPDICLKAAQPSTLHYRNTDNTPFTYTVARYGAAWFNIACGDVSLMIPAGQDSSIDLTAAAELDCQSTLPQPSNSWCESRFLVNGLPLSRPDNTGRGDTFAWDSANGGRLDWQAHVNDMWARIDCRQSREPCPVRIQLQGRFQNGATSLWVDDLKLSVTASLGPVLVTTGPPTP